MATVSGVAEAQWTAKRAFGVYYDNMDACGGRWKDEGVIKACTLYVYTSMCPGR